MAQRQFAALQGKGPGYEPVQEKEDGVSEFAKYRRTNIAEMRGLNEVEREHGILSGVSVSEPDLALATRDRAEFNRGFVARNPQNHADQWYVARAYFEANFEPA
jgi:hypothetical protein